MSEKKKYKDILSDEDINEIDDDLEPGISGAYYKSIDIKETKEKKEDQEAEKEDFFDIICFMGDTAKAIVKGIFNILKRPFSYIKAFFIYIANFFKENIFYAVKSLRIKVRKARKDRKGLFLAAKIEASQEKKNLLLTYFALRIKIFKQQRKLIQTVFNWVAPIVSIVVLILTINHFSNTTLALAINYNGESIGYILDESVYNEAEEMAAERLEAGMSTVSEDTSDVLAVPTYELKRVSKNMLTDAVTICDRIIEGSTFEITNACGVYIDNEFVCAVKNETDAIGVFENILEENAQPDAVVDFLQDINYEHGLYPDNPQIVWGTEELTKTAENISIQAVKTEKVVETIPFKVEKTNSSKMYTGDTKITVKGKNGSMITTKLVTYVDGEKVSEEIVSQKVTKKPVTQKVLVGTLKKIVVSADDGQTFSVGGGKFTWPVPSIKNITSYYGQRWGRLHAGIDISGSGATGSNIVAAASGVVESVSSSYTGYGYSLVINHGNGIRTRYAHCIAGSIKVSTGQTVSKGQVIGLVGNTGNSTGPHLHFEVLVNGSPVDPLKYL